MSAGKRVLVVDDDDLCRRIMTSMLSEFTVGEVGQASDGMRGLEYYMEFRPDLVFMDVEMPNMDGFEALKRIRDADHNANVIMFSASATKTDVIRALKLGARHYIRKDLPKDCLRPVLRQLMA